MENEGMGYERTKETNEFGRYGMDEKVGEYTPSAAVLAAARRLVPDRGSGIERVTLSANGRSVTLTAEDGARFDRAQGMPARWTLGATRPDQEFFGLPAREEFVLPAYIAKGGDPHSEYAPLRDFLPAPEVAAIAQVVIAAHVGKLRHLLPPLNQQVEYLWKREGGESAGRSIFGKCTKASGLTTAFTDATWVIWVAADNCFGFTNRQMEALVFHELLHTNIDDKLKPKLRGHDVEEFMDVIAEYGFVFADLRRLRDTVRQLPLFDDED
jgi:hypothetical protein